MDVIRLPTPVRDILESRAISSISELRTVHSIEFGLAYELAVGRAPGGVTTPETLKPPEMEAFLDLLLAMQEWYGTGDVRPPQDHLEVLGVLRRIGGRVCYIGGTLTRHGASIVERYEAERGRRPIRSR